MVSRKAVRRSVPSEALPAFTPVPRKVPRHDGWTPERQRAFIEALADTGCVAIAARMVNMSKDGVYQLRRQPGAESFRAAMDAAQTLGLQPVRGRSLPPRMHGQLVPVFVGGKLMGFRRKKNDRLLMFIPSPLRPGRSRTPHHHQLFQHPRRRGRFHFLPVAKRWGRGPATGWWRGNGGSLHHHSPNSDLRKPGPK